MMMMMMMMMMICDNAGINKYLNDRFELFLF